MTIANVGFFRELKHGDPEGPSLRETVGEGDAAVRDRVADFLLSGTVLATTAGRAFDVLAADQVDAGPLAVQTDGRWMWPSDLPHYVRQYNVALPAEFVDWARSNAWTARQLSRDELLEIEEQMFADETAE